MPPEQLALEVLMEKSTPELERLRCSPHDSKQALAFEDCLNILIKAAGVLWANIVECCALLGNVGEVGDGEADGVSKFG